MPSETSKMIEVFLKNDLYLIPLHSIKDNECSCKNEKCSSQGKHPFFRYNWKIIATNDSEKITSWLKKYKSINFGVATGRKSSINSKYLTVIDIDEIDHEILKRLPRTFSYQTGSGGYHYWYWSDMPVRNSVSKLAPKVDIRGKNGYVVVPPSKHKKGSYKFIYGYNEPIASLPQFIVEHIKESTAKALQKRSRNSVKAAHGVSRQSMGQWTSSPVAELREALSKGLEIPHGVRNVTIHRLLSSDRAKGAIRPELVENAFAYRKLCADWVQIPSAELESIVASVIKYPTYNTAHENVNKNYFQYLRKRGIRLNKAEIAAFDISDNAFFQSLEPSNTWITLAHVKTLRESILEKQGFTNISTYRPQLLAKKLRELGFVRKRTSKGNLWNIGSI